MIKLNSTLIEVPAHVGPGIIYCAAGIFIKLRTNAVNNQLYTETGAYKAGFDIFFSNKPFSVFCYPDPFVILKIFPWIQLDFVTVHFERDTDGVNSIALFEGNAEEFTTLATAFKTIPVLLSFVVRLHTVLPFVSLHHITSDPALLSR